MTRTDRWSRNVGRAVSLAALVAAAPLAAQTTAADSCGSNPQVARFTVLGRIQGLSMDANPESPWFFVIGVPRDSVVAVTAWGLCLPVVTAALNAASTADTLPLQGVIRLGARGFVVVRGRPPTPEGRMFSTSVALLGPTLELKSYQRMTF